MKVHLINVDGERYKKIWCETKSWKSASSEYENVTCKLCQSNFNSDGFVPVAAWIVGSTNEIIKIGDDGKLIRGTK